MNYPDYRPVVDWPEQTYDGEKSQLVTQARVLRRPGYRGPWHFLYPTYTPIQDKLRLTAEAIDDARDYSAWGVRYESIDLLEGKTVSISSANGRLITQFRLILLMPRGN